MKRIILCILIIGCKDVSGLVKQEHEPICTNQLKPGDRYLIPHRNKLVLGKVTYNYDTDYCVTLFDSLGTLGPKR